MKKNNPANWIKKSRRHVLFVFLFLSILILSIFSGEELFSETNPSLKERKKTFEQKAKLISEIQSVFPEKELTEKKIKLEKSSEELTEIFKRGNEKEKKNAILKSEMVLSNTQKTYVDHLTKISEELIHKISMANTSESVHKEQIKETRESIEKKEKATRYFSMAKEEFNSAEKFSRDGNLSYALHIYKRSIRYSLSSIKTMGNSVEKKYELASEKWASILSKVVVN